jgi:hypothetical protein
LGHPRHNARLPRRAPAASRMRLHQGRASMMRFMGVCIATRKRLKPASSKTDFKRGNVGSRIGLLTHRYGFAVSRPSRITSLTERMRLIVPSSPTHASVKTLYGRRKACLEPCSIGTMREKPSSNSTILGRLRGVQGIGADVGLWLLQIQKPPATTTSPFADG